MLLRESLLWLKSVNMTTFGVCGSAYTSGEGFDMPRVFDGKRFKER